MVTPHDFQFQFRHEESLSRHYAMIGMAVGREEFHAEAVNERGLCMAGLNFRVMHITEKRRRGKEILPHLN